MKNQDDRIIKSYSKSLFSIENILNDNASIVKPPPTPFVQSIVANSLIQPWYLNSTRFAFYCPPTDLVSSIAHSSFSLLDEVTRKQFNKTLCQMENKDNISLKSIANNFLKQKKKRSRAAFSHSQVLELEKRFNSQRYLNGPERADLASSLKVS
jgi:hypothetical protein